MVLALAGASHAQENTADFYRGKTMKIVVGFPPGGGFDLYARIIIEHLPRFIPGSPKIIVENMPGAATARAAAHVFRIAPQDGTVLGLFHHALLADQALATKPNEFDITKFNWIGRMATRLNVGVTSDVSGVKSIADAKLRPVILGATAPTATSAMVPRALNHATGTQFKSVLGYQGSADMTLAMERGEIAGFATAAWRDITRDKPEWVTSGKIAAVFQISTKRAPDLAHVPTLPELATNDEDLQMLELLARTEDMGRAFPVGPRVPADRVALLREAFAKMMVDPAYLLDAARYDFEIDFMSGEAVQSFVAGAGSLTPEQRARIRKILMP